LNSRVYHLITSEYPPQAGGVSDYTQLVATGLAEAGDEVHVWCPPAGIETTGMVENERDAIGASGVFVHRELGGFAPSDLRRVGRMLDQFSAPRHLLVQWVPHGYGYRSMNLSFCVWLLHRAWRGRDRVEVMVHEPYLTFSRVSWKQNGVAAIHRLMTMLILRAARRVWMSIPLWESFLRPYTFGRALPFFWLPVASNIPVVDEPLKVKELRARYAPASGHVVGHFGTYDRHTVELLMRALPLLLNSEGDCAVLLLGRGSEVVCRELIRRAPEAAGRIAATGTLSARELSLHIGACDLLLQPYIDGVSSRRTSMMVGLAHGLPIVTTSGRLTEDLWTSSGAVALAPVEDVEELVETTRRVLSDEASRRQLSIAASALYHARFDAKLLITTLREAVSSV
jgi:glycosyltransferase involved in cell wall biosynthesis